MLNTLMPSFITVLGRKNSDIDPVHFAALITMRANGLASSRPFTLSHTGWYVKVKRTYANLQHGLRIQSSSFWLTDYHKSYYGAAVSLLILEICTSMFSLILAFRHASLRKIIFVCYFSFQKTWDLGLKNMFCYNL